MTVFLGLQKLRARIAADLERPSRESASSTLRSLVEELARHDSLDGWRDFAGVKDGESVVEALITRLEQGLPSVLDRPRLNDELPRVDALLEGLPSASALGTNTLEGVYSPTRALDRWQGRREALPFVLAAASRYDIPELLSSLKAKEAELQEEARQVRPQLALVLSGKAPLGRFAPESSSFRLPDLLEHLAGYYGPENHIYPFNPTEPGNAMIFDRYRGPPRLVGQESIGDYLKRMAAALPEARQPVTLLLKMAADLSTAGLRKEPIQRTIEHLLDAAQLTGAIAGAGMPSMAVRPAPTPPGELGEGWGAPPPSVPSDSRLSGLSERLRQRRIDPESAAFVIQAAVSGAQEPRRGAHGASLRLSSGEEARLVNTLLAQRSSDEERAAAGRVLPRISSLAGTPTTVEQWSDKLRQAWVMGEESKTLAPHVPGYREEVNAQFRSLRQTRGLVRETVEGIYSRGARLGGFGEAYGTYTLSSVLDAFARYYAKEPAGFIPNPGGGVRRFIGEPLNVGSRTLVGFLNDLRESLSTATNPYERVASAAEALEEAGLTNEPVYQLLAHLERADQLSRE